MGGATEHVLQCVFAYFVECSLPCAATGALEHSRSEVERTFLWAVLQSTCCSVCVCILCRMLSALDPLTSAV